MTTDGDTETVEADPAPGRSHRRGGLALILFASPLSEKAKVLANNPPA